jgi:electron transfer flavoprotein beta subunit
VDNFFYTLNLHDKAALEEAIRVKESVDDLKVTVITVGPPRADDALRSCLTMGADKAIRIWNSDCDGISPYLTSVVLAKVIETLPYLMIFCGFLSMDTQDGYIGSAIAESLNLPQVSGITRFEPSLPKKEVIVHRRLEKGGREIIRCPLPAVFMVDRDLNEPRYASLPTFLSGLKKDIILLDPFALDINFRTYKPTVKLIELSPPKPRTKRGSSLKIASLSPQERLKAIMTGVMKEKKRQFDIGNSPGISFENS